jgi:uncharacterized protein DUF397
MHIVVPPGVRWHTSSRSGDGANCVEFATAHRMVWVRDSKDPEGPALAFAAADWELFVADLRDRASR